MPKEKPELREYIPKSPMRKKQPANRRHRSTTQNWPIILMLSAVLTGVIAQVGLSRWSRTRPSDARADETRTPIYIAPNGNDSSGNGSSTSPYRTLKRALTHANRSPNYIIYFRDGTYPISLTSSHDDRTDFEINDYHLTSACDVNTGSGMLEITVDPNSAGQVVLSARGDFSSAGKAIFRIRNSECIRVNGRNRLVIDGAGATLRESDYESLVSIYSYESVVKNIIFENTTVRNSTGKPTQRGIHYYQASMTNYPANIIIRGNTVHDIADRAIGGFGNTVTIQNNVVYNAAMANAGSAKCSRSGTGWTCGGWPGIISIGRHEETGEASKNIIIRGNTVRNSWGEGIIAGNSENVIVSGNTVTDSYSVGIYIDNSRNVTVTGNVISQTNPEYYRLFEDGSHKPLNGISLANEATSPQLIPLENITIANNLIYSTRNGINYYWVNRSDYHQGSTYRSLKIINNVIRGSSNYALSFSSPSATPGQTEIRNNVIYKGSSGSYNLANPSVFIFTNNIWPDGIPTESGISHQNSYSCIGSDTSCPGFVGGSSADPAAYKITSSSRAYRLGIQTAVTTDFWGTTRPNPPSIGIHEPSSGIIPSSSPNPTTAGTSPTPTPRPPTPTPVSAIGYTPTPTRWPTPTTASSTTPNVNFAARSTRTREGVGRIWVRVNLSRTSRSQVTVRYRVVGGSAVRGVDYSLPDGTLTFAAGTTSRSFAVNITDDHVRENSESIVVRLSNPSGARLGSTIQHTINITDND